MSLISKRFADELNEKEMRDAYLAAQTRTHLAYQIRAIRCQRDWSQGEFANILRTSQSAVSRMEDRQYGKLNLQTLFEIAAAFDCGLVVQFVPYTDFLVKTRDLSPDHLAVNSFTRASLDILTGERSESRVGGAAAYLGETGQTSRAPFEAIPEQRRELIQAGAESDLLRSNMPPISIGAGAQ
jgi:transcriptional regulator with XRE-family HTH domain